MPDKLLIVDPLKVRHYRHKCAGIKLKLIGDWNENIETRLKPVNEDDKNEFDFIRLHLTMMLVIKSCLFFKTCKDDCLFLSEVITKRSLNDF